MLSTTVNISEAAEAVRLFNLKFGKMEEVAWCLSRASRTELLSNKPGMVLPEQVWTVKVWMGVQGVKKAVKTIAPQVLAEFEWTAAMLDEGAFAKATEDFATERVSKLASRMKERGARRREFSLSSKVLHWLLPARIPVFDQFVRDIVGVPRSWQACDAYKTVVEWEFESARKLMDADPSWMGNIEPRSLLHGLDKYLWWKGGGEKARAVVVKDPQKVLRRLKIDRSKIP